jgi:dTDP-4-dehydrorhamnose 3,5-epimerase-like enzyme
MARIPVLDNCFLHYHQVRRDARGSLLALEATEAIPFPISRVYFLYDTPLGKQRGFHAHRRLEQWAVCVAGGCTMILDNGRQRSEVRLDSPEKGLHVGAMIWRELKDFSPGAVLMVLASEPYEEADYIRDYESFLALAGQA